MPTAREYLEEAVARGGPDFGIRVPITSLTTTTVVCSTMARGEPSSAYERKFIYRLNAANVADRVRQIVSFAGSTGTFTHEGTNYVDTTATGEYAIISSIPPEIMAAGLQQSVQNLRYLDAVELPSYPGSRYWLRPAEFPWLTDRSKITRVYRRTSPVLTRNRTLQRWPSIDTSGVIEPPDAFTLTGASATLTREAQATFNLRRGAYVARLTRAGTDCYIRQTISVLPSGADLAAAAGQSLVGETITAVVVGLCGTASRAYCRVGFDSTAEALSSDFHSGGGEPEELTCSGVVPSGTKYITIDGIVVAGNVAFDMQELYLVRGDLTDGIRRDDYTEEDLTPRWTSDNPISFELPSYGLGSQIVIESYRPYPGFDPTRLYAGSADGDSHDAPLAPVAAGVLYRSFEAMASTNRDKYGPLAQRWGLSWESLAGGHTRVNGSASGGPQLPRQNFAGAKRLSR